MPGGNITLEKILPHSVESERAVLGAIILDHKAIFPATEVLTVDDFYLEGHREIFRAMLALAQEETSIDLFTLREEIRRRNKEEAAGGPAYLAGLTDGLPRGVNVGHYARTVGEKATSRQLIQLGSELMSRCYADEERPAEILERMESQMFRIASREIRGGFQPTRELASEAFKEIEETSRNRGPVSGIDTGFIDLNRMTGGLHRQNLVVVAARPGLGKTSFCLNVACHAAIGTGKNVGIFSLEMSKPEITKRMISSLAEVDAHRIQSGYLSRDDWGRISTATSELFSAGIFVDDSANLTMLQLRAKAQRLALERGLDLLIVDYLQLVSGSRRYENRTQEVTEISRGLKNLAKELDIPVIAVSQLNREVEKRSGSRRPQLSDLRESGCLAGDTLVTLASGNRVPFRNLVGMSDLQAWSLNQDTLKLEKSKASNAFCTGTKPVFRLTTGLGRSIRATANHKFLTVNGWKRLDELSTHDRIALPRKLDQASGPATMRDAELGLLGIIENTNRDVIPLEAVSRLVGAAAKGRCNYSRERAGLLAVAQDAADLHVLSESDVYWDRVASIAESGTSDVYDLTVPGNQCFVANDIIVHNSIEQDSDLVLFISREGTDDDAGSGDCIAEVSIGKQRNGMTGTFKLNFKRRITRFENHCYQAD